MKQERVLTLEIAMCHASKMKLRAEYLAANTDALTAARAARVMQNHAKQKLLSADLGYFAKRSLRKWAAATRPERDNFLTKAEATLKNHEVIVKGPLDAWQKFFKMGLKNPANTPGSIQTHFLHDDPKSDHAREVAALGRFQALREVECSPLCVPLRWPKLAMRCTSLTS